MQKTKPRRRPLWLKFLFKKFGPLVLLIINYSTRQYLAFPAGEKKKKKRTLSSGVGTSDRDPQ